MDILGEIFSNLGFGKLSEEDVRILIETADSDGDGKISLQDFRIMLQERPETPILSPKLRKTSLAPTFK